MAMFEIFAPLKNRQYRLFFTAHSIALIGTGLSTIALALFAFKLDNSQAAQIISFALAVKMFAYIGFAPIIGAFADRLPRKLMMISFDLVRAGILIALPLASETWHIYIMIFALNLCSAGFTPLYQATLPSVFKTEAEYSKALSLSRMTYDLENLLNPTIAAILLFTMEFSVLFHINSLAFVISALILKFVVFPANLPSERQSGIWHNVSFGVKSYLKTPRLRGLLSFNFIAALSGALIIVNSAHFAQNLFDQPATITAFLFAAVGCGSLIMSLILPRLIEKFDIRHVMIGCAALVVMGLLSFSFMANIVGLFVVWFLLGIASAGLQTPSGLVIQQSSSATNRPAFFSAQFTLTHMGWLIAYVLAGQFGQNLAIELSMFILAICALAMLFIGLKNWKKTDAVTLKHSHDALQHLHPHIHDEHHQHEHEGWEGPEPHVHEHRHAKLKHTHDFYIDEHHLNWPNRN